jgi:transcriptional repressor NrdR
VIESRPADAGAAVRRRRRCATCGERFTTFERRDAASLKVIKRNGTRERFDREKLLGGLLRAAHKRPVGRADAEGVADEIAAEVERAGGELPSGRVGELALAGLAGLDRIAYLQFAAVYKGFDDPSQFHDELERLGVRASGDGDGGQRTKRDPGADPGDGFRPGRPRGSAVTATRRSTERD